ncbi:Trafficking protein particle complex subunit 2 [Dillenia turbinata]|uniref:Trafficking protein particle complex subunit 2 n=1 Tax=Dillenia turbinata TaxID=194707 RepID=A0AAN8UJB9_9MAGN
MATTACFIIVSSNDIPIYEAEIGSAPKTCTYLKLVNIENILDMKGLAKFDFILLMPILAPRFLKSVDRFNDLVVSVYVTAGHIL